MAENTLITSDRLKSSKKQLSTGISEHVFDKQILRGHDNRKFPRSSQTISDISHVQKQTSPIAVHMKLSSAKRRVDSNVVVQLIMHLMQECRAPRDAPFFMTKSFVINLIFSEGIGQCPHAQHTQLHLANIQRTEICLLWLGRLLAKRRKRENTTTQKKVSLMLAILDL